MKPPPLPGLWGQEKDIYPVNLESMSGSQAESVRAQEFKESGKEKKFLKVKRKCLAQHIFHYTFRGAITMNEQDHDNQLIGKIKKLQVQFEKLQGHKGDIFGNLQTILREAKYIKNKFNKDTLTEEIPEMEKIQKALNLIETKARSIEELFNAPVPEEVEASGRSYKVNLKKILNFGILDVESTDSTVSVVFKGKLFKIMNALVKKYIDDMSTSVPVEFRGYINRMELEKMLYGEYIGRNRLNSHITRIRTMLIDNGLTDTTFIKSLEEFVRLNIDSYDVYITEELK